jgi:hypothetical protein
MLINFKNLINFRKFGKNPINFQSVIEDEEFPNISNNSLTKT